MANRHSGRFSGYKVQKTNLVKEENVWVKNVLLVDINKVSLLPPDCGDEGVSKESSMECENITENSTVDIEKQYLNDSVEGYVTITELGKCFVAGCSFSTKSFVSLLHHVLSLHKEVNRFSCCNCSHTCSLSEMVRHLRMHGPTMFQCKYCSHCHFSELKVHKHIELKHVGCPIVVVELRNYKEEEGSDVDVKDEDEVEEVVDLTEIKDEILNKETSDCETQKNFEVLENSSFCTKKVDITPKTVKNVASDLGDCGHESKEFKMNECNGSLIKLNSPINDSQLVKKNDSINKSGDLEGLECDSNCSEDISVITPEKNTKLTPKLMLLSFESDVETKDKKINLKSTVHNYHSSELELRKDSLEKNWQCGLCDYVGLYNNMIAHTESAHAVKYQFKCSKCSIFIASRGYVESHCVIFHPNTIVTLIANYYLPGSSLPFPGVVVTLPGGQEIFTPDKPVFSKKIPEVFL